MKNEISFQFSFADSSSTRPKANSRSACLWKNNVSSPPRLAKGGPSWHHFLTEANNDYSRCSGKSKSGKGDSQHWVFNSQGCNTGFFQARDGTSTQSLIFRSCWLKELLAKRTLTKFKELGLARTKIESNSVTTTVSILHFIKVILDKA